MSRRIALPLVLLTATLMALAGCSDDSSPTSPSGGFDVAQHFTEEEAVVTKGAAEINLRLVGVQFGTTSSTPTAASLPVLDKFRQVFEHYEGATYTVEAHMDERGSASYNLRMSQDRADAVRSYLVDTVGGTATDIAATGYGESRPLDAGHTAAAWERNRRVEVVIHLEDEE